MADRPGLLDRLRRLFASREGGEPESPPPGSPRSDDVPSGCEDVAEIPCEEAARRVYEYLDEELDPAKAEEIRCHVLQCQRCYPMYNWERLFLRALRERGGRAEASEELRRKVERLLDSQTG